MSEYVDVVLKVKTEHIVAVSRSIAQDNLDRGTHTTLAEFVKLRADELFQAHEDLWRRRDREAVKAKMDRLGDAEFAEVAAEVEARIPIPPPQPEPAPEPGPEPQP